jgi:hypothetical protein
MKQQLRSTLAQTQANPYSLQAPAEKYWSTAYLSPERLSSIGHQFRLAGQTGGQTFLNIGAAHGLLEMLLRHSGAQALALDLDFSLQPNIVGGLPRLPVQDACVDVTMAFQVLEHLPFEMLPDCLLELSRVARKAVLISLPDRTAFWQSHPTSSRLEALAIWFHHWAWARKRLRLKALPPIDPEHFWEIDSAAITSKTIVTLAANSGLSLHHLFRNPYFAYHVFFYFEKK